jgi:transcriptional regulator with XRE-family HTH domain
MKNRFLEIRLSKGYKFQKDFAKYLGISQYQYTRYENNERQPSLEVLLKICDKLDMDIRDIYAIKKE